MHYKLIVLLFLPIFSLAQEKVLKPKYAEGVVSLSQSNEYFREKPSLDFWVLNSYYVGQETDSACSLASVTMVMNAIQAVLQTHNDAELITQEKLIEKVANTDWKDATTSDGEGVALDELVEYVKLTLKTYEIPSYQVSVVHVEDVSTASLLQLRQTLYENEKNPRNFIIANFDQGVFTGDDSYGHYAPVAAYDSKRKRVLILDPDRDWFEPYWVQDELFMKGLATRTAKKNIARGYIAVKF